MPQWTQTGDTPLCLCTSRNIRIKNNTMLQICFQVGSPGNIVVNLVTMDICNNIHSCTLQTIHRALSITVCIYIHYTPDNEVLRNYILTAMPIMTLVKIAKPLFAVRADSVCGNTQQPTHTHTHLLHVHVHTCTYVDVQRCTLVVQTQSIQE